MKRLCKFKIYTLLGVFMFCGCFSNISHISSGDEVADYSSLKSQMEKKEKVHEISSGLSVRQLSSHEFPKLVGVIEQWIKNASERKDNLKRLKEDEIHCYVKIVGAITVLNGFLESLQIILSKKKRITPTSIYACFADQNASLETAQGFCIMQNHIDLKRVDITYISVNPDKIILPENIKCEEDEKRKSSIANKKGIGTILVAEIAKRALENKEIKHIELISINNSQTFYEKLGFKWIEKEHIYALYREGMQKLINRVFPQTSA